jgi:hypothetical protein
MVNDGLGLELLLRVGYGIPSLGSGFGFPE